MHVVDFGRGVTDPAASGSLLTARCENVAEEPKAALKNVSLKQCVPVNVTHTLTKFPF